MTRPSMIILIALFSFLQTNCKKEPPVVYSDSPAQEIVLILQDTSCTEVWLKLSLKNFTIPHTVKIYRDSNLTFLGMVFSNDTTLIDTTLLPNRNYNYTAVRFENGIAKDSSKILQATTLDTTSHEIVWETTLFGEGGSSILYDVGIVNDTLLYAVGQIYTKDTYTKDSLGNVINPFNIVRWNKNKWELFTTSDLGYGYGDLYCIEKFSSIDIWVASSIPEYWDGNKWKFFGTSRGYQGNFSIKKLWGLSTVKLFLVGDRGSVGYYNGSIWQMLSSNTTANINDIWGSKTSNGDQYILAAASTLNSFGEKKILRINGNNIDSLQWNPRTELHSLWFESERKIFTAGDGVYIGIDGKWNRVQGLPSYYSRRIRGTAKNDVWVVGDFGLCAHFNGMTWKSYPEVKIDGIYHSVAITNKEVIAVGEAGRNGVILRGKRK